MNLLIYSHSSHPYKIIREFLLQYNIKVTCSLEDVPMGTAGPIRLAEKILRDDNEAGMFFVFNSDVICEYPLDKMI